MSMPETTNHPVTSLRSTTMSPRKVDIYDFISGLTNKLKKKEIFNEYRMRGVDSSIYYDEMNRIINKRVPIGKIRKKLIYFRDLKYKEIHKKHPDISRVKKYATMDRLYTDVMEFIGAYVDFQVTKQTNVLYNVAFGDVE